MIDGIIYFGAIGCERYDKSSLTEVTEIHFHLPPYPIFLVHPVMYIYKFQNLRYILRTSYMRGFCMARKIMLEHTSVSSNIIIIQSARMQVSPAKDHRAIMAMIIATFLPGTRVLRNWYTKIIDGSCPKWLKRPMTVILV